MRSLNQGTTIQSWNEFVHVVFLSVAVITPLSSSPPPLFHLSQGNVTFSCAEPIFVAMTFTGPQSFLCLPGVAEPSSMGVSVGLQFRTWNEAGLLLTFKLSKQGGAVWLYLSKARLHLQVHKYGRVPLEFNVGRSDIKPPTWNLFFPDLKFLLIYISSKSIQHLKTHRGYLCF